MVWSPEGRIKDVRDVQLEIAKALILVTPEGMIKDVRVVQPANALFPTI